MAENPQHTAKERDKPFRWNKKKAIVMTRRFMEGDDIAWKWQDDHFRMQRYKDACEIIDAVSDRFDLDINEMDPAETGWGAVKIFNSIIRCHKSRRIDRDRRRPKLKLESQHKDNEE